MIKTGNLREIIKLSLYSAYLKGEKSVSVLIIAKPESGKTHTMFEFSMNDGIAMLSDITYTGLINLLQKVKDGSIKTVLVPDMLKIFGRKAETSKNFITLLNEFIEEGIVNIETYQHSLIFDKPIRGNIITGITSTDFFMNVKYWGSVGFLSRIIPFSYSYSIEDVNEIFREIMTSSFSVEFQKLKFKKPRKVSLSLPLAERIRTEITSGLMQKLVKVVGEELYGFRIQRSLQMLAKASAYAEGSKCVRGKDVDKLVKLAKWMNYEMNALEG